MAQLRVFPHYAEMPALKAAEVDAFEIRRILVSLSLHFGVQMPIVSGGGPNGDAIYCPWDPDYDFPTLKFDSEGCSVGAILQVFSLHLLWQRSGGFEKADFRKTVREVYAYSRLNILKGLLEG